MIYILECMCSFTFEDDDVWHERLLLWPLNRNEWYIESPDGDQYPEHYRPGTRECSVVNFHVGTDDGSLPAGL